MKIVLCGIGEEQAGDDYFGPYLIEQIEEHANLIKFNCGLYLENYLNKIVDSKPDLVIFFDTIRSDNSNSKKIIITNDDLLKLNPGSTSTHSLPFSSIYMFIKTHCHADVWLIGIKALSYNALTDQTKELSMQIADYLNSLDSQGEMDIIKIYETLSHILR